MLLGTVSGLQWMLKGFLERKLLDIVSEAVVENNAHERIVAWDDVPVLDDLAQRVRRWQAKAAARE